MLLAAMAERPRRTYHASVCSMSQSTAIPLDNTGRDFERANTIQAVTSFIWSLATIVSDRRLRHHRPGIPPPIQLFIQPIIAAGATACFALLIYHLQTSTVLHITLGGAMIALLGILM